MKCSFLNIVKGLHQIYHVQTSLKDGWIHVWNAGFVGSIVCIFFYRSNPAMYSKSRGFCFVLYLLQFVLQNPGVIGPVLHVQRLKHLQNQPCEFPKGGGAGQRNKCTAINISESKFGTTDPYKI